MKKKFELNLDALLVIALLFVLSLGLNFVQYSLYSELLDENFKLYYQSIEDKLNLDSNQTYIKHLRDKYGLTASE